MTISKFIVGYLQEIWARLVVTKRNLKKAQKTILVSGSCAKTLTGKGSSLTQSVLPDFVERTNLCAFWTR